MSMELSARRRPRRRLVAALAVAAVLAVARCGATGVPSVRARAGVGVPPEPDGVARRQLGRARQGGRERGRGRGDKAADAADEKRKRRSETSQRTSTRGRTRGDDLQKIKEEILKRREENRKRKAANERLREQPKLKLREQEKVRDGDRSRSQSRSRKQRKPQQTVKDTAESEDVGKRPRPDKDKDNKDKDKDKDKDKGVEENKRGGDKGKRDNGTEEDREGDKEEQANGGRGRKKKRNKRDNDKYDVLVRNGVVSPRQAARLDDEEKETLLLLMKGEIDGHVLADTPEEPRLDNAGDGGGADAGPLPATGDVSVDVSDSAVGVDAQDPPAPTLRPTPESTPRPTEGTPTPTQGTPQPSPVPTDATPQPTSRTPSDVLSGSPEWSFVDELTDASTPLDGFERGSDLDWTTSSVNPWEVDTTRAFQGEAAIRSGIALDTQERAERTADRSPIYSNLTLTTDDDFSGGALTFEIWARRLTLPREAFFVSVDGKVALTPSATHTEEANDGINGWVEYSVPVGPGAHEVTWSHVHNPFGMPALPPANGAAGLWMDNLRLVPFTSDSDVLDVHRIGMTNGGERSSAWELVDDGSVAVAVSSERKRKDDADIRFELNSEHGGMLEYQVKTSTTGPHHDFAILLGEQVKEAIFGNILEFEGRRLAVPPGRQFVTLRHRTNPGNFGRKLLKKLGKAGTEGKTWLKDLKFEQNNS